MAEGVDGLLRDKTRPPGIAPLKATLVDKVVALTLEPPDHEATHWTVRAMAKAVTRTFGGDTTTTSYVWDATLTRTLYASRRSLFLSQRFDRAETTRMMISSKACQRMAGRAMR